ncbi:MAG: sigma-70 family RNA polymerase sigma factor, partial [Candidatus Omnitrophota bacterium]
ARGIIVENNELFTAEEVEMVTSDRGLDKFLRFLLIYGKDTDARQGLIYGYPKQDVLDLIRYIELCEKAGFDARRLNIYDEAVNQRLHQFLSGEELNFVEDFYHAIGNQEEDKSAAKKLGFRWFSIAKGPRLQERDKILNRYLEELEFVKASIGLSGAASPAESREIYKFSDALNELRNPDNMQNVYLLEGTPSKEQLYSIAGFGFEIAAFRVKKTKQWFICRSLTDYGHFWPEEFTYTFFDRQLDFVIHSSAYDDPAPSMADYLTLMRQKDVEHLLITTHKVIYFAFVNNKLNTKFINWDELDDRMLKDIFQGSFRSIIASDGAASPLEPQIVKLIADINANYAAEKRDWALIKEMMQKLAEFAIRNPEFINAIIEQLSDSANRDRFLREYAKKSNARPFFDLTFPAGGWLPLKETYQLLSKEDAETEIKISKYDRNKIDVSLVRLSDKEYLLSLTIIIPEISFGVPGKNARLISYIDEAVKNEGYYDFKDSGNLAVRAYHALYVPEITYFYIAPFLRQKGLGEKWYRDYIEPELKNRGFKIVAVIGNCLDTEEFYRFWRSLEFSESFPIPDGEIKTSETLQGYICVKTLETWIRRKATPTSMTLDARIQFVIQKHQESYGKMEKEYGLNPSICSLSEPVSAIRWLLENGYLGPGKKFCDPFMGNGLPVHLAHIITGADATGIEIDSRIYEEAVKISDEFSELGLVDSKRIHLIQGNSRQVPLKDYDVIYLYPPWPDGVYDPMAIESTILGAKIGAIIVLAVKIDTTKIYYQHCDFIKRIERITDIGAGEVYRRIRGASSPVEGESVAERRQARVIEILQHPPDEIQEPRRSTDWHRARRWSDYLAALHAFGSWHNALEAAGIKPLTKEETSKRNRKWTDEVISTTFRNPPSEVTNPANYKQWERAPGFKGFPSAVTKRYGSWAKGVAANGIEPIESKRKPVWQAKYTDWCKVNKIIPDLATSKGDIIKWRRIRRNELVPLIEEVRKGNTAAAEALLLLHMRLVQKIARRYMRRIQYLQSAYGFDDLVEAGLYGCGKSVGGLARAIELFSPEKGYAFSTYAWAHVEGNIRMFIARIKKEEKGKISLEMPLDLDNPDITLEGKIADKRQNALSAALRNIDKDMVLTYLEKIGVEPRDREIYVLHRVEGESQRSIGRKINLSGSRISQIIQKIDYCLYVAMKDSSFSASPLIAGNRAPLISILDCEEPGAGSPAQAEGGQDPLKALLDKERMAETRRVLEEVIVSERARKKFLRIIERMLDQGADEDIGLRKICDEEKVSYAWAVGVINTLRFRLKDKFGAGSPVEVKEEGIHRALERAANEGRMFAATPDQIGRLRNITEKELADLFLHNLLNLREDFRKVKEQLFEKLKDASFRENIIAGFQYLKDSVGILPLEYYGNKPVRLVIPLENKTILHAGVGRKTGFLYTSLYIDYNSLLASMDSKDKANLKDKISTLLLDEAQIPYEFMDMQDLWMGILNQARLMRFINHSKLIEMTLERCFGLKWSKVDIARIKIANYKQDSMRRVYLVEVYGREVISEPITFIMKISREDATDYNTVIHELVTKLINDKLGNPTGFLGLLPNRQFVLTGPLYPGDVFGDLLLEDNLPEEKLYAAQIEIVKETVTIWKKLNGIFIVDPHRHQFVVDISPQGEYSAHLIDKGFIRLTKDVGLDLMINKEGEVIPLARDGTDMGDLKSWIGALNENQLILGLIDNLAIPRRRAPPQMTPEELASLINSTRDALPEELRGKLVTISWVNPELISVPGMSDTPEPKVFELNPDCIVEGVIRVLGKEKAIEFFRELSSDPWRKNDNVRINLAGAIKRRLPEVAASPAENVASKYQTGKEGQAGSDFLKGWYDDRIFVLDNRAKKIKPLQVVSLAGRKDPLVAQGIKDSFRKWLDYTTVQDSELVTDFVNDERRIMDGWFYFALSSTNDVEGFIYLTEIPRLMGLEIAPWNRRHLREERRYIGIGHQLFAYSMKLMIDKYGKARVFVIDNLLIDMLAEAGVDVSAEYGKKDVEKLIASQQSLVLALIDKFGAGSPLYRVEIRTVPIILGAVVNTHGEKREVLWFEKYFLNRERFFLGIGKG